MRSEFIKYKGKRKEVKKKELELLRQGYIVFIEPYDDEIWYLVARKP